VFAEAALQILDDVAL
jgi:hypothetical protein